MPADHYVWFRDRSYNTYGYAWLYLHAPDFARMGLMLQNGGVYNGVRIAQAKNSWFAGQRRNSANEWANRTLDYFGQDYDLQLEWNAMLDGKWDQMMRQTHYGYRKGLWRAPIRDMVSGKGASFVKVC